MNLTQSPPKTKLVPDSDITVVIQGPLYLDNNAKGINIIACLKSIKTALPNASVLISTWEEERCHDDQIAPLVNQILYSVPPAAIVSYGYENNITRQIASTILGLSQVKTVYALKIRANILIDSKTDFFSDPGNKINILALVLDPITQFSLFSIPDFVQFGKTKELKLFWNISISPDDYLLKNSPSGLFNIYTFPYHFKFSPEQYLGITWAKNKHEAKPLITHQFDVNYSDFLYWKDILSQDFNTFSPKYAGFLFGLSRYTQGKFIDADGRWLKKNSRVQFIQLLIHKYLLFGLRIKWWKQLAKYFLFKMSESTYWTIHGGGK